MKASMALSIRGTAELNPWGGGDITPEQRSTHCNKVELCLSSPEEEKSGQHLVLFNGSKMIRQQEEPSQPRSDCFLMTADMLLFHFSKCAEKVLTWVCCKHRKGENQCYKKALRVWSCLSYRAQYQHPLTLPDVSWGCWASPGAFWSCGSLGTRPSKGRVAYLQEWTLSITQGKKHPWLEKRSWDRWEETVLSLGLGLRPAPGGKDCRFPPKEGEKAQRSESCKNRSSVFMSPLVLISLLLS